MSDINIYNSALSQVEDKIRIGVYSGVSLGSSAIGTGGSIYNTSSNLMATTATSSAMPNNSHPFKSANYSM
jgi:hypothetical protein